MTCIKPYTGSCWDDNILSVSAGDASVSSSQMLRKCKPEFLDHQSSNVPEPFGVLQVGADDVAAERPNNGVSQTVRKKGFVTNAMQSVKLDNSLRVWPRKTALCKFHFPTLSNLEVTSENGSPITKCGPFLKSINVNRDGCMQETGKSKHAVSLGSLGSKADACMLQVCPICSKFSSASNIALNAHIDHCLILNEADIRPAKKRFKIRKLRSMVDIYATAASRTLEDLERDNQMQSMHRV
ncbi:hypothetical protein KP509_29G015100 [Ceratopteris richardii]|nr:hypothetical protein KP509_29G015100 [Ceratopteris richardii]